MLLKLRYDGPLKRIAFNFNLRRYNKWEGTDYAARKAANDKRDIADYWVSQLGDKRRERVSTVEMIDGGAGLGLQAGVYPRPLLSST
jgi:hypothetical protein